MEKRLCTGVHNLKEVCTDHLCRSGTKLKEENGNLLGEVVSDDWCGDYFKGVISIALCCQKKKKKMVIMASHMQE